MRLTHPRLPAWLLVLPEKRIAVSQIQQLASHLLTAIKNGRRNTEGQGINAIEDRLYAHSFRTSTGNRTIWKKSMRNNNGPREQRNPVKHTVAQDN